MNERIKILANNALHGDIFPQPINYEVKEEFNAESIGRGIKEYLKIQPIEFRQNEYICDRYRFNKLNTPSDYYRVQYGERAKYWCTLCSNRPRDVFYWGWTHVAIDYEFILNNGFNGLYKKIDIARKNETQKGNQQFYDGLKYCVDGICERYAKVGEVAKSMATTESNLEQKKILNRLADTFTRIPLNPAETFFDAVQLTWLSFLLAPDSLGRIDQYLYPFYKRDIESGLITKDFAFELLEELFIKVHESQADNVGLDISGHNHLVVGGYLQNGDDGFNELSKLILEAIVDLPTYRPQASFRYTNKTTEETMRFITEMNNKSQLIVFVNDEPRIKGMIESGFDKEDAIEYTVIGCNEWAITGKSRLDLAHINLVHSIENVIYQSDKTNSYEEFYSLFEKELEKDCWSIIDEYANYAKAQKKEINVLTSLFYDECISSGRSFTDMGSKYYGLTMSFNSISNVADSLSAIKQFVFEEKIFTYDELLTALKDNWVGHEDMRTYILKKGHFFGNDDDYVDSIAQEIVNSIYRIKLGLHSEYIKNIAVGSFVGATSPNIIFGKMTKATPDGRYGGEEFTMGVSQSQSKDAKGITALLKSIAKLDYSKFCGCIVSNLKMDNTMADTPEKIDRLSKIYHTFLKLGGMQLQINYISTEELLEAQKTPDNYKNLMVRVTGYSGFFTKFNTDLQNDIIKRTAQR